jgi:hypothetical protein
VSEFIVQQGTPVLLLDVSKLERRELTRDVDLDRAQLRYHVFEVKGHLILVPSKSLQMGRIVSFTPGEV